MDVFHIPADITMRAVCLSNECNVFFVKAEFARSRCRRQGGNGGVLSSKGGEAVGRWHKHYPAHAFRGGHSFFRYHLRIAEKYWQGSFTCSFLNVRHSLLTNGSRSDETSRPNFLNVSEGKKTKMLCTLISITLGSYSSLKAIRNICKSHLLENLDLGPQYGITKKSMGARKPQ